MIHLHTFYPGNPGSTVDLGWLLQNPQASDEEVCSFLLIALRAEMERLVSALLPSPADSMSTVDNSIVWAILNRQNYKSEVSGKNWLYTHLLGECMRLLAGRATGGTPRQAAFSRLVMDAFDPGAYSPGHYAALVESIGKDRALLLVLYYGHDLSLEEIAALLQLPPEQVVMEFKHIQEQLLEHQRVCPLCASTTGSSAVLESLLRKTFHATSPVFDLDETQLQSWKASILKRAAREQSARSNRIRLRQFIQACLFVMLLAAMLLSARWLSAGHPFKSQAAATHLAASEGTNQIAPTISVKTQPRPGNTSKVLLSPEPTAQLVEPPSDTEDISTDLNLGRVLQLANNSQNLWHTLWADVQVTGINMMDHGNISMQVIRKQAWISQPSLSRVIIGLPAMLPSTTYTVAGGNINGQSFESGQEFTNSTAQFLPDTDLQKLFMPEAMFISGGTFHVVGRDRVAGRPTWVLEWSYPGSSLYRFWVDTQYGVILHRREVEKSDPQTVITDILVHSITFNAPFSPAIFELSQYAGDHFAGDFSGVPEIPDPQTALAAWSPLKTQPPSPGSSPIDLSAIRSCERSPDGRKIAYASAPQDATGNTMLMLTDRSSIPSGHPVLPGGITSGDYAFSPDGGRLAFFGCDKASGFCGVNLLDTKSGQLTRLLPLIYASYIFWKPDGRYLAMAVKDNTTLLEQQKSSNMLMNEISALAREWHFLVVDASSGAIVYKQPFDWFQLGAPAGSPTFSWDTPFKTRLNGPEGCGLGQSH